MTAVQQAVDDEEDPAQEKVKEGCNDNPGAFGRPPLCAAAGIYDDHFPKCISIIHRIIKRKKQANSKDQKPRNRKQEWFVWIRNIGFHAAKKIHGKIPQCWLCACVLMIEGSCFSQAKHEFKTDKRHKKRQNQKFLCDKTDAVS